ncbi:MAG: hypothetical protein AABZ47_07045 [Planctomycetota bacterium]
MNDKFRNKAFCAAFLVVPFICVRAQGVITITIAPAPPADTVVTPGETIAMEFFYTSDVDFLIKGAQAGMACSYSNGTTTLTIVPNGISPLATSAGGIAALCPGGLAPYNPFDCYVARAPQPLAPPCSMVAGQMYYMATFTYRASDCSTDPIVIRAEPFGVADGAPEVTDESRVRDNSIGNGNLVPIVAENFSTLIMDAAGVCCRGFHCEGEAINQTCCAAGAIFRPAVSCAEPLPCPFACTTDAVCTDNDPCNGLEACNLQTGQCYYAGALSQCRDSDPCTNNFCDVDHPNSDPETGCAAVAAGVMYTRGADILLRSRLDGSGSSTVTPTEPVATTEAVRTLAVDIVRQQIYWTDPKVGVIKRAGAADGSGLQGVVYRWQRMIPGGIRINPLDHKMYWFNQAAKSYHRANTDGSSRETLFTLPSTEPIPYSSAIDPWNGVVYWETGSSHRRASFDGSDLQILNPTVTHTVNIAVDVSGGKIYWTGSNSVWRSNLPNGSDPERIVESSNLYPTGLDLDLNSGKLYVMVRSGNTTGIRRANLDGTDLQDVINLPFTSSSWDLALDAHSQKLYWSEPSRKLIYQLNTDGTGLSVIATSLVGPYALAVDSESGDLVWDERDWSIIRRANLDGSNSRVVVTQPLSPAGLALNSSAGNLFYTDRSMVFRADLDGTNSELLFEPPSLTLNSGGIALDQAGARMFWFSSPYIYSGNLDGGEAQIVIEVGSATDLKVSILLDTTENKLYWTTPQRIHRANLDGSAIELVLYHPPGIRGFSIDPRFGKLYWTDGSRTLRRCDLDGSETEIINEELPMDTYEIVIDPSCSFQTLFGDIAPPEGDGIVDLDDLLCVLVEFSDTGKCPTGDIYPCEGNGFVDLEDLLTLLDAMNGIYACPPTIP